jgi:hypothetical protein
MTTQEQILEAQAKLKELETQRESEITFPIYTKYKGLNLFARIDSRIKSINVYSTDSTPSVQVCDYSISLISTNDWSNYVKGTAAPCTREEFESARTETLKKLSEI